MTTKRHRTWLLFVGFLLANGSDVHASVHQEALRPLVKNGGLIATRNGSIIFSQNEDSVFLPASVVKTGTALAAIGILGKDYRFTTEFYLNSENDLFIRGQADPFLVSEEITKIAQVLHSRGIKRIRNIYLDDTACKLGAGTEGTGNTLNPYDAENGCLAVNFNTVHLRVGPKKGQIQSAEKQTPTLPLMRELAKTLAPGTHRINVTAKGNLTLRYAGELFRAIFEETGIQVGGKSDVRALAENMKPHYVHRSSTDLDTVLRGLLLYSNNFIANQVLLACGAAQFGWPATWEKGKEALTSFYRTQLKLSEDQITVADGSGLSRQNRMTPRAVLTVLEAFKPHAALMPKHKGTFVKSGTLTGVYAYAGYFPAQDGSLDSFVLILNQPRNTRERVLEKLSAIHRQSHNQNAVQRP